MAAVHRSPLSETRIEKKRMRSYHHSVSAPGLDGRGPSSAQQIQSVLDTLPGTIRDFALSILRCEGCVALLCFLAHRPQTANTDSDLANLLDESVSAIQPALETLAKQGAISQFTAGGKTFFQLTRDKAVLGRILEFLKWREQWVARAWWLMENLEAANEPESRLHPDIILEAKSRNGGITTPWQP